jgi:hypothetical protein
MAGSTDDESKPGAREGSVLFQTFIHLMCMCLSTASRSLSLSLSLSLSGIHAATKDLFP